MFQVQEFWCFIWDKKHEHTNSRVYSRPAPSVPQIDSGSSAIPDQDKAVTDSEWRIYEGTSKTSRPHPENVAGERLHYFST